MNKRKSAGPFLVWSGLTLILLPVAAICVVIAVALAIAYPPAAVVFLVLASAPARSLWDRWRADR